MAPLRPAPAPGAGALRPVTDADLAALAALLPDDVELDPRAEQFPGLEDSRDRQRRFVQGVWHSRGSWSPRSWCLDLGVEAEGELVGLQSLEGDDFGALRTVDSASWLVVAARGRGIGTSMRPAALGLAFDHLGAVAAVTSAVLDNHAKPRRLASLGYADNGRSRITTRGRRRRAPAPAAHGGHVAAAGHRVEVTGVEPCLRWFGVSSVSGASTARNASSPGSAWTSRIRRFTVAAP